MSKAKQEPIPNLLRPDQVKSMESDKARLEGQFNNPYIQDKAAVASKLRMLDKQIEADTPKPYEGADKDAAVKRVSELRERIQIGMPTQSEMRKAPPGAVEKELKFQKAHKDDVAEYKYRQLRLHSGDDDNGIASIERFRPYGGSSEMNMDNAQIPGTDYNFGASVPPSTNHMSDEDREAALAERDELAQLMAGLKAKRAENPQRAQAIESELLKAAAD